MKKCVLLLVVVCCCLHINAQQQGLKLLIQRIALLQIYLGYLKKGYELVEGGINTIKGITNAELNLHTDYFNSLKSVNPKVKKYKRVAEIIAIQVSIIAEYKKALGFAENCSAFAPSEIDYIYKVYSNLISEAAKEIDLLMMVITSEKLEMKDDERLGWIDRLYESIRDKSSFLQQFNNEMRLLAKNREKAQNEIKSLRNTYDVK